jgi:hypothetical protein
VKGIRFFECPQGHGAIVRPEKVKVLHSQLFTLCILRASLEPYFLKGFLFSQGKLVHFLLGK